MRVRTVVISLVIHGAIAATLLGAAGKKAARRPTSVAFTEEKKKAKPAPPKPPPPPPQRPVARAPERKLAAVSRDLPEPVAKVAAAPMVTALAMSNDDAPGGIALAPRGPVAKAAAAAPTKVASAVTESRRQRLREAAGAAGEDAPCNEDPSKPVPIAKQPDIELTASARAEGVEGRLILSLTVGADGTVTGVRVTKSLSAEMDAAAEAAVKQWRFKPAMACGKAVAGTFNLGRTFELGD